MMPLLMTTIMNLVPPETRGKTIGNISIVISVAPAIGPTISGLILSTFSWRWLFLLVLRSRLLHGARRLADQECYRSDDSTDRYPIDRPLGHRIRRVCLWPQRARRRGTPSTCRIPLDSADCRAIVIALFVLRQSQLQKQDRALLDLRTLSIKVFAISTVMMAILMMSMFGVFILLPIYLQNVLGLSTLQTGLLLLPGGFDHGSLRSDGRAPFRQVRPFAAHHSWGNHALRGDVGTDVRATGYPRLGVSNRAYNLEHRPGADVYPALFRQSRFASAEALFPR